MPDPTRVHRACRPGRGGRSAQAVLLALAIATSAQAQFVGRVELPAGEAAFTDAAVVRGIQANAAQCAALPGAVWAQPPGDDGECIRYWQAGLQPGRNAHALIYFGGDLLAGNTVFKGYEGQTPADVQKTAERTHQRLQVPYLFIARPGTFGSSGEHRQRRRVREARLLSAAIDQIKKRHEIGELAVTGQSGGGHVVASLVGYRSDIVCAVPGAAVSSPRMRVKMRGWSVDATGYSDSHEPAEHLEASRFHPQLRVFVVGDPQDSNVPWPVQTVFAERVKQLGGAAETLAVEGSGPERHSVTNSSLLVGSMCLRGSTTEEIRQRAAQGLKG